MEKRTNNFLLRIGLLLLTTIISGIGCSDSAATGAGAPLSILPGDVNLRLVASVAVFGGSAGMTNQGTATVIIGDIGTTGASTMITGYHNSAFSYTETPLNRGAVTGSVYSNAPQGDAASFAIATAIQADASDLFDLLAAMPGGSDPGVGQLGGLTLAPGVYKSGSGAFLLTGSDLTLDAQGNADAIWVFQMDSSLTVGDASSARSVILANGAQAKNVYWQVGSAATINGAGGGTMVGTIISRAGATFSTAGNAAITKLNGRVLSLVASVTLVNTNINAYDVQLTDYILPDLSRANIQISGSTSGDVTPVITGGGFITVVNDGGHVAATVTGTGAINAVNNGAALTATLTGSGPMNIVNNGQVLSATNTGNGRMTIHSTCTGAVTVNNTGDGNITVYASGSDAITLTFTDGLDHVYGSSDELALMASHISVSGANSLDVAPVLTGNGYINVMNNGAHVAATQTGDGTISIVNNGVGCVIAATNTGSGTMTINSTATAAVTVTNTGNGRITVYATGSTPITITHNGDDDYTYGDTAAMALMASHITVSGSHPLDVAPVLNGSGYISVVNNGAHVAATQTGDGTIAVVNNGVGCVIAATNTGSGKMTISSTATAAVAVTMTGNGNVTVYATGSTPLALVYNDDLDHVYPASAGEYLALTTGTAPASYTIPTITGGGFINVVNNVTFYVTATVTGTGTINVLNNGEGVTATLTGSGPMNIVNNGTGPLTVTNTGNGKVSVNNTCSATVTITNTGNGRVIVDASGSNPITLTHTGDDDYTYTSNPSSVLLLSSHISVSGSNVGGVTRTLTGTGYLNIINNSTAAVTVTESSSGTINVNNDGSAAVTATESGGGMVNIITHSAASGAVTATNNGTGVVTIGHNGTGGLTVTNSLNGRVTVNNSATAGVTITNNSDYHVNVIGSAAGGTFVYSGAENVDVICDAGGACSSTPMAP